MFDILRRKKGLTFKLFPLMDYQIKNFLQKNHAENVLQKQVLDLFIILVNNPKQPLHIRNSLKSKIFGKSKSLKKGNFMFSFEPSPLQQTKLSKTKRAWN